MPHWQWAWCAEIDPFARAVLRARHPHCPNLGDVAAPDFAEKASAIARPDVIVFGSPCQSFSIAGRRLGLDDPRGNLALLALRILARIAPAWFVFENVPGLLSLDDGKAFEIFLKTVDELRYYVAWASLDAQHFGVAQRRERLFVVGHSGDWRYPAAILFEQEGVCGHSPPRRTSRQGVARDTAPSLTNSGRGVERCGDSRGQDPLVVAVDVRNCALDNDIAHTLQSAGTPISENSMPHVVAFGHNNTSGAVDTAGACSAHGGPHGRLDFETETFVVDIAPTLESRDNQTGGYRPPGHDIDTCDSLIVADPIQANEARTYSNSGNNPRLHNVIAFAENNRAEVRLENGDGGIAALNSGGGKPGQGYPAVAAASMMRRLTPRECERLQGFPDDFTLVRYRGKPAADGPRYRALGNAMAVPVIRWILQRIEYLETMK
jgi:DNA (cytosine-5)-methyltransferase 1